MEIKDGLIFIQIELKLLLTIDQNQVSNNKISILFCTVIFCCLTRIYFTIQYFLSMLDSAGQLKGKTLKCTSYQTTLRDGACKITESYCNLA